LNILLGLLAPSGSAQHAIQTIHRTSRWLRGRAAERFWDTYQDSREWDEDDSRKSEVPSYVPGKWDAARYALPMEVRVHLGINWLRLQNMDEAMVSTLTLVQVGD
jgi:general transcription factor 3C polypeptide 3 (transcription factor C subunit 4)